MRRELQESPATRFVGHVLVDEQSREPVLYTENLFVKFYDVDRERCLRVLRDAGLSVKQELPYAANAFFVAAPEGTGRRIFDIADELLRRDDVEYCNPELVRRLGRRAVFAQQWHLKATTVGGQWVSTSANVEAAHTVAQGAGTTIAIIETGIDVSHEEFSARGKIVAPATRRPTTPTRAPTSRARSTARPARGWPAATEGSGHPGWRPARG